jgi:drug/metabolite transporter (DMT)-like permease
MFGFGETRVSSALAGIINGATPLMTLLAILIAFPEERPTRQRIIGLLVGFVGVLVVIGIWNGMSSSSLIGVLALLVAITCYGISYPYVRRHLSGSREHSGDPTRKPISPIALATGLLIMATIQTAPIVAITGVTSAPVTSSSFFALLALGVLGSGIAYILNFRVIALSDATTASTVTYLTPLVAVIVGAVLLQEKITWHEPVGAVLIVIGAATAQGILTSRRRFTAPS